MYVCVCTVRVCVCVCAQLPTIGTEPTTISIVESVCSATVIPGTLTAIPAFRCQPLSKFLPTVAAATVAVSTVAVSATVPATALYSFRGNTQHEHAHTHTHTHIHTYTSM